MGRSSSSPGRISRRAFGLALTGLAAGCGSQGDLSAGEQGRISRILDGDSLSLDTGLRTRLVEIEAPAPGYGGRPDEPFALEARQALAAATLGRQARPWYGGLSRDSYERALAPDVWLNGYMVRQGAARVRTWPDNSRRARRLLALETEARGQNGASGRSSTGACARPAISMARPISRLSKARSRQPQMRPATGSPTLLPPASGSTSGKSSAPRHRP